MKKIYQLISALAISATGFAQTSVPYTSSGPFVVPPGVTSVTIEVVGAGGDGGFNGGGGGGGGGYAIGTYTVTPGATFTVTVGNNGMGGLGGSTSVDMLIAASGGENGSSGGASPGGTGGIGINGSTNRTGGAGGNGTYTYFGGGGGGAAGSTTNGTIGGSTPAWTGSNCLQPGGASGIGGGLPGGNGGKGSGFTEGTCTIDNPATPGMNYGGGGGGGNGNSGPASQGADGYCVITYNSCPVDLTTSVAGTTITSNATGVSYQWIDCSTGTHLSGETNASYTASATGDYAVILDNGTCTDTSDCVNINCTLDLSTTVTGFTITANETAATSYGWVDCSTGTQIVGENSGSYTATSNGDYALIIQVDGCIDTSSCITISGVGINDEGTDLTMNVYPNPFSNKINIQNKNGTEYFELINAQGQLVWSGKNIETADFTSLPQGVYVLTIQGAEFIQRVAVMKK